MSDKPNYRHTDYAIRERILARLAKDRRTVTPMRWCSTHAIDWDSRHTTNCPECELEAFVLITKTLHGERPK